MKQKGTAYKLLTDRHLRFCALILFYLRKKVSVATANNNNNNNSLYSIKG